MAARAEAFVALLHAGIIARPWQENNAGRQLPFMRSPSKSKEVTWPGRISTVLVVRALRPPVAAEVRVHRGLPIQVRSAVSSGDVVHVSGPWRTTGRWWSDTDRYALDHFDIQVSDGTVSRLCFDWYKRCWRIDGLYD